MKLWQRKSPCNGVSLSVFSLSGGWILWKLCDHFTLPAFTNEPVLGRNQGTKYRLGVTLCFLWMKFSCRIRVFLETWKYFHVNQFRFP